MSFKKVADKIEQMHSHIHTDKMVRGSEIIILKVISKKKKKKKCKCKSLRLPLVKDLKYKTQLCSAFKKLSLVLSQC